MKSLIAVPLVFSCLISFSCSSSDQPGTEQLEKIADAVKASPAFSDSELENFEELDTLFIAAQELPRYRQILDDIKIYDSILSDAEKIRAGKTVENVYISEENRADINRFIETTKLVQDEKRASLTALINNSTDTMYKVECTEHMKNSDKTILTTHAIIYLNSYLRVIDFRH